MARQPRHPCPQDMAVRKAVLASGKVLIGLFAQAELEQGIWQDELVLRSKQRSLSAESSISIVLLGGDEREARRTCLGKCNRAVEKLLEHKEKRSSLIQEISIPCLVKQPKQPEVKGVIGKDLGDRISKKSRYIPKRLVGRVEKMETEKVSVEEISGL